ncbi:Carbamoyl-phosphate synthase arginine-specific large chain [Fusarium oxysporum f. sp. albedinis]|nr:Carbamoyl-phosphate synthase arginine-specific large chain [Fusarium oxysporum f. sp. albedinis]
MMLIFASCSPPEPESPHVHGGPASPLAWEKELDRRPGSGSYQLIVLAYTSRLSQSWLPCLECVDILSSTDKSLTCISRQSIKGLALQNIE